MELVPKEKISQIGATADGARLLRKMAGRSESSGAKRDSDLSPTAPFSDMKDAYRALFVFGLLKGERLPAKPGQSFNTIYANLNMLTESFDFQALVAALGNEEDLEDLGRSVNEYTNWAVEQLRKDYSAESFELLSKVDLE